MINVKNFNYINFMVSCALFLMILFESCGKKEEKMPIYITPTTTGKLSFLYTEEAEYETAVLDAGYERFEVRITPKTKIIGIERKNGQLMWKLGGIYVVTGDIVNTLTLKKTYAYKRTILANIIHYKGAPPYDPDTALKTAIVGGGDKVAKVEEAIKRGANLNHKDNLGNTWLHYAVEWDQIKVIKLLIDNGMDVNERGYKNETPIYNAIRHQNANVVELLIKNGADLKIKNNMHETPWELANDDVWGSKECRNIIKKYNGIYKWND